MARSLLLAVVAVASLDRVAAADPARVHVVAGAGHALTSPQDRELGWGGGAGLAIELGLGPIGRYLGAQLSGDVMGLTRGERPRDPTLAPRSGGALFSGTAGLRVHALGLWIDGGAGVATSGSEVRPTVSARLGYDLRVGGAKSPWVAGPFVGYVYVYQPKDTLRPEDAHLGTFGLHVAFDPPARPLPTPSQEQPVLARAQPTPPEVDQVPDATDACAKDCADVLEDGDHLVLGDRIQFDFDSPRVREESLPLLRSIAAWALAHPDVTEIDVDGHADDQGAREYNMRLSKARAETVKATLQSLGVTVPIVVRAFGSASPVASGAGEQARAQNRRVELRVRRGEEGPRATR